MMLLKINLKSPLPPFRKGGVFSPFTKEGVFSSFRKGGIQTNGVRLYTQRGELWGKGV